MGKLIIEGGKELLRGNINGMIFDLDGTLADTSPDIAAALNAALRDTGQTPLPVPDVISMIGDGIPTLVERGSRRRTSVTGSSPRTSLRSGRLTLPRDGRSGRSFARWSVS